MDPNAQKNYAPSRDSYPSLKQPSLSSDTKLPTGHGLPPSSYTTDKQNTSQSQNSYMTSKQDVSLGEGFLRNFTRDQNIYRSAFNDPSLHFPDISHNDTINLDYSANPLVYKAKNDSSAWLTEMNDATLLKAKDSPDSTIRSIYKNNMYDPPSGYIGNSNYVPYGNPYYQNSNPFGTSAPLSQLTEVKFDSDMSSLSQPRTILSETTLESMRSRVKSALLRLKSWEESRVENINNHRRICENIFETLSDRISASKLGLKRMIKFFTERIKTIRAYAKLSTTFPKLDKSFTNPTDDISAWVFPKLLKEFDDFQFKHIEKSKVMADFMENEILIHILGKEERRFKEKVEPLIKNYKRIKANLIKENERAAQATAEYVGLYKRALNSQKIDKDLFVVELGFMKQAYTQTMAQKELGKFTAEFISELQNLEIARLQNLTQAMKTYVETMHLLYGFENNNLVLGTMSKLNIQQEIQKIYALNRLVKDEDMEVLRHGGAGEAPESSLDVLINYLNAIEFHHVKTNPLLLYETKASAEVNGQMFGTKSSSAALTVDRHVVIYDINPENLDCTVHKMVSFSAIVFKQTKTTSNTIEFFEVRKKIVGNNLKHVNITFPNGLEKKMFMEIYQKFNH